MNTELLKTEKLKASNRAHKIDKLLTEREDLFNLIDDIKYLQKYAGEMLFSGKSGKINECEIIKTVKINTLRGCVAVPKLLIELAEARLAELENQADDLYT